MEEGDFEIDRKRGREEKGKRGVIKQTGVGVSAYRCIRENSDVCLSFPPRYFVTPEPPYLGLNPEKIPLGKKGCRLAPLYDFQMKAVQIAAGILLARKFSM